MVTVDVFVPAMNVTYDFQLDENTLIQVLIDEIVEILLKKTGGDTLNNPESFLLCNLASEEIFNRRKTLADYRIRNGNRLMIV